MTFAVSRDQGAFEWAGNSLGSLFAQWRNIASVKHWRMIFDIIRFNQFALDLLNDINDPPTQGWKANQEESVGDYLDRKGYSAAFRDNYIIPMTACVWSTSPDKCSLAFPVKTLVRFLWNHHLMTTISARPPWLTIPGGSKLYIDAVLKGVPADQIHLNTAITSITNKSDSVILETNKEGEQWMFDEVILACHGDQAFEIVSASANAAEMDVLGAFKTSANTCYLHSDLSLMPKRRTVWSSWNYLTTSQSNKSTASSLSKQSIYNPFTKGTTKPSPSLDKVSLTYNMNILQHIPPSLYGPVLVTMNPPHPPAPETIQGQYEYTHPLFTPQAVAAQKRLHAIQGTRGVYYCGAWTKFGFHEDGFTSGMEIATQYLGAKVPFEVVDSTYSRGRKPQLGLREMVARRVISLLQLWISVAEDLITRAERMLWLPMGLLIWILAPVIVGVQWALVALGVWEEKGVTRMKDGRLKTRR
jgi:predicted NAD/FAD-binding protein